MSQSFIGEIRMFGGAFAPQGWALCNGQTLPISQNTALFALLGTTYGGNGTTTFALPNLQGASPLHTGGAGGQGQGPGLSPYSLGESGGETSHTLTSAEMPAHAHTAQGVNGGGAVASPAGNTWAATRAPLYGATASGYMNSSALASAGGNQAHNNMPPYLVVNFIISLQGIFPQRP